MLYTPNEVEISAKQLENVFRQVKGQVCLLGGWATYYLVNENFEKANGRKYIGSRDIDIGFHIDKNWTEKQLEESDFSRAIKSVEAMGFRAVSFRLVKDFDAETGMELTEAEAAKRPLFQVFQLYIDPVVDYIHPDISNLLGFVPIDEPFLSLVFEKRLAVFASLFGMKGLLPLPEVLLAMKLNSARVGTRRARGLKT
jgi:hypothetical protein